MALRSLINTKKLIMANRTTIADILAGYEVAKSIISNLNQEEYLNALVAGLNCPAWPLYGVGSE